MCADLGASGAHCAHTYITQRRDIAKFQWDQMRTGWLCLQASDFSDTEDSLDELCRETSLCNYETKQQIEQFKGRMKPLLDKAMGRIE